MQTRVKATYAERFDVAIQDALAARSKNGRPLKHKDYHRYADEVDYLPGFLRQCAEIDPRGYYAWCAKYRRKATAKELEVIAQSKDHKQGTLDNAEPAQSELNFRLTVEVEGSDEDGAQFWANVEDVIACIQRLAARKKKDVSIRYMRNVACRELRGVTDLAAQYGGRLYATDVPDKNDKYSVLIGVVFGTKTPRFASFAPYVAASEL